jgi:hypothetical protein
MTRDDATIVVPLVDPYWLLRLDVKQGECVPYHLWLLYAHQTQTPANPRTLPA